eukprot:210604-Chlamydomonas_euryale.AAC.1
MPHLTSHAPRAALPGPVYGRGAFDGADAVTGTRGRAAGRLGRGGGDGLARARVLARRRAEGVPGRDAGPGAERQGGNGGLGCGVDRADRVQSGRVGTAVWGVELTELTGCRAARWERRSGVWS